MKNKFGYIHKKSKNNYTTLNIVYNIGSAYENENTYGISHLMEHLITKSVDKYQERFINDCIEFNAYTSMTHVVVYFKGLDSKLTPEFKNELVNCILNDYNKISVEEFENEKKIVTQEIYDAYEDNLTAHYYNILYGYFGISVPTGMIDCVNNYSFEESRKYAYEFFKHPARIVEFSKVPTNFDNIDYNTSIFDVKKPKFKKTNKYIIKPTDNNKVYFYGISKKIVSKKDYPYLTIGLSILSDGLQSPFYQEFREKNGLCYSIILDTLMIHNNGIVSFEACTTKENIEEFNKVFEKMNNDIKSYLNKERFENIINLYKTRLEVRKCFICEDIDNVIKNEDLTMPKKLDNITYEKVVEVTCDYFGKNMFLEQR